MHLIPTKVLGVQAMSWICFENLDGFVERPFSQNVRESLWTQPQKSFRSSCQLKKGFSPACSRRRLGRWRFFLWLAVSPSELRAAVAALSSDGAAASTLTELIHVTGVGWGGGWDKQRQIQ